MDASQSTKEHATRRNDQLDLLRAVAIAMVVSYHLVGMSPVALPGLMRFTHWGQYGVDLFFVLSGWLIGSLYWHEQIRFGNVEVWRFWGRRWFRTIPPYLVAMMLAWLAVRWERHESFHWGYLMFVQNYYERLPYFLVSWSLCIEEHFYLVFPLLLVWFSRSHRSVAMLFSTLIIIALVGRWSLSWNGATPAEFGFKLTATHLRLEGLVLGFWAAYVSSLCPGLWSLLQKTSPYVAIGAAVTMGVIAFLPEVWMYRLGLTMLALCFAALLAWLMHSPRRIGAGRLLIKAVAISSYSVYLIHALMLHVACGVMKAVPAIPWFGYFPIALALIAFAGALFYFLVERPSIKLRDQWIARRTGVVIENQPPPVNEQQTSATV